VYNVLNGDYMYATYYVEYESYRRSVNFILTSTVHVYTDDDIELSRTCTCNTPSGCCSIYLPLYLLQNAGQVKRQQGSHVVWEEPWESIFNFYVTLQQPLLLFIDRCTSDVRRGEGKGGIMA